MSHSRHLTHLPDDLCSEIFHYLPVKSLLRFRSVSKPWLSLIDSPDFARSHLTRFPNNLHQSRLFAPQRGGEHRELPCPSSHWYVCCTSDGLFILECTRKSCKQRRRIMIWNPSTRTSRFLPPLQWVTSIYYDYSGFGFDPLTNDYKLFISCDNNCSVCSIKHNSWKDIIGPSSIMRAGTSLCGLIKDNKAVCVNATLFWINIAVQPPQLVSFNLSIEMFAESALPELDEPVPYDYDQYDIYTLAKMDVGGRTLSLLITSFRKASLWGLEGLGGDVENWRWTKRYTFSLTEVDDMYFSLTREYGPELKYNYECIYIPNNQNVIAWYGKNKQNVILWKSGDMVVSYDVETRVEDVLQQKGIEIWPYLENMILL